MTFNEAIQTIKDEYDNIIEQVAIRKLFGAHVLNWRSPANALLLARIDFERINEEVRQEVEEQHD